MKCHSYIRVVLQLLNDLDPIAANMQLPQLEHGLCDATPVDP